MNYIIENRCYFDNIEHEITKQLSKATASIKICVAWISLKRFEALLLRKINQGVKVRILCTDDYKNGLRIHNIDPDLISCLSLVSNPLSRHYMHHKFCIIDDSTLITGSYNWSGAAAYHYENIVVISNDFNMIRKFKHEFADLEFMASLSKEEFKSLTVRKSTSNFKLGTLSSPRGILETVTLQIWDIDLKKKSYTQLSQMDVPSFLISIEIPDDRDQYYDEKEWQIDLYNNERNQIMQIQKYFDSANIKVNALGQASVANEQQHLEYGEEQEYEISLFWVDMRLKKILPSSISAQDEFYSLYEELYY